MSLEILSALYPNNPGMQKAEVLYDLAKKATGPIAEVGCATGFGTIALALGSRDGHHVPVFAIDPFFEVRGWANEPYGPDLKFTWYENVMAAGVLHIVQSVMLPVETLANHWPYPVSLTFWDLGRRIDDDISKWLASWAYSATRPGGILAINETGGHDLGVDEWINRWGLVRLREVRYYIRITEK